MIRANLSFMRALLHDAWPKQAWLEKLPKALLRLREDFPDLRLFLREAVTDAEVAALLKQQGCKLQNDFQVRKLPAPMSFEEAKARADQLNINAAAAALKLDAFAAKTAAAKPEAAK